MKKMQIGTKIPVPDVMIASFREEVNANLRFFCSCLHFFHVPDFFPSLIGLVMLLTSYPEMDHGRQAERHGLAGRCDGKEIQVVIAVFHES